MHTDVGGEAGFLVLCVVFLHKMMDIAYQGFINWIKNGGNW